MELTTEDKERIQQYIEKEIGIGSAAQYYFRLGAEYEHKYQREQQKKLSDKRKLWDDENNNLIKELGRRDGNIQKLEAERSEVRNKVIEQAIDICKDYEVGWQVADIIEKLNSLKTK